MCWLYKAGIMIAFCLSASNNSLVVLRHFIRSEGGKLQSKQELEKRIKRLHLSFLGKVFFSNASVLSLLSIQEPSTLLIFSVWLSEQVLINEQCWKVVPLWRRTWSIFKQRASIWRFSWHICEANAEISQRSLGLLCPIFTHLWAENVRGSSGYEQEASTVHNNDHLFILLGFAWGRKVKVGNHVFACVCYQNYTWTSRSFQIKLAESM